MTHVIVGVRADESEQPALRWAASYAAATGGRLLAVSAWEPDQAELPPDRFEEMEAVVRRHLAREVREAEEEPPEPVGFELHLAMGEPGDVLRDAAEAHADDAELIVVGHPEGALPRLTSDVLRLAGNGPLPVVIAQGAVHDVEQGPIIVGVDGSDADIAVLAWAGDLARRAGTTVHAALAVPEGEDAYPHPQEATEGAERLREIEDEVQRAAASDDRVPDHLAVSIVEGRPDHALLALAHELGSHLVVVGRGRGRLLDKVPAHLAEDGTCNIAVVPATLPPSWHHEHGEARIPGEPAPVTSRWKAIVGWAEEALGWATADDRVEAEGAERRREATASTEGERS